MVLGRIEEQEETCNILLPSIGALSVKIAAEHAPGGADICRSVYNM